MRARFARIPLRAAWLDLAQLGHAAAAHLLDHEDVAVAIEAGVVRMDKPSILPSLRLGAHHQASRSAFIEHAIDSRRIESEVGDDLVVLVEQRDAGVQVGDEQKIAADVDVVGVLHRCR